MSLGLVIARKLTTHSHRRRLTRRHPISLQSLQSTANDVGNLRRMWETANLPQGAVFNVMVPIHEAAHRDFESAWGNVAKSANCKQYRTSMRRRQYPKIAYRR